MSLFGEILTFLSKIQLKHKIILIIVLTLSIYTIITSETISLLIGFDRNFNRNGQHLLQSNWDRRRGFRTLDSNGNLLYYHLPNLTDYHISYYYKSIGKNGHHLCHMNGTNWNETNSRLANDVKCICNEKYTGTDCGIPSTIYSSINIINDSNSSLEIERLSKPKRLVLSVILHTIEDDSKNSLLETINKTLKKLSDFVDLFIITEINIIDRKANNITNDNQLNCGSNETNVNISAKCHQNKWIDLKDLISSEENRYSDIILYSTVNLTTKQVTRIGANDLHLYILSKVWTTSTQRVTDFRPNDMLIYMSSNTFPLKEILMFFKHYTGYPEPIKLISNEWPKSVKQRDSTSKLLNDPIIANNNRLVNIAVTFEYLSLLCRYDFKLFKNNLCANNALIVSKFNDTYWPIHYWTLGHNTPNGSANIVLPLN